MMMTTTTNLKTTVKYLSTEMMTTHYHIHQPTSMSTSTSTNITGNVLTDNSIPLNNNKNIMSIGIPLPLPTTMFLNQQHSIFVNSTFTISNVTLQNTTATALSTTMNFRKDNDDDLNMEENNSDFWNLTWPKAFAVSIFIILILITIIGNTLVILAVSTTRRLRTVTNCFVMNLAITDWLVGTFVMPPAVVLYILESWRFGWVLCDIWISLDVLLCTASILSLCAISLDRYLAVIQPLTYSKKRRSKRLALFMILIVWILAFSITCPPFLGWYEQGRRNNTIVNCRYNQNKGYVVFSAMGSFFIPLFVMLYVYLKIGYVLTSRRQRIERAEVSEKLPDHEIEGDNFVSESECATIKHSPPEFSSYKGFKPKQGYDSEQLSHQGTFYELLEISRSSSLIRCSTITCKYDSGGLRNDCINSSGSNVPLQSIHFTESHASFSESCLSAAKFNVQNSIQKQEKCPNHLYNHHQQQQQAHHQQQNHHHTNVHHNHQHQHQHPHQHQHQHSHHPHRIPMRISTQKRDSKTAKTLTMVMGGFIACWLPFFIYYILIPFLPRQAVSEGLMSFLTWVGWVNCAINPFIYAFYNPDFRTAFWRLTFRKIFKRPSDHLSLFRG